MNPMMKEHSSRLGIEALMNVMIEQPTFAFGVEPWCTQR